MPKRNKFKFLKNGAILVLLLVLSSPSYLIAADPEELKEQLRQQDLRIRILQDEVAEQQQTIGDTQRQIQDIYLQVASVENELAENESRIAQLSALLQKYEADLNEAKNRLSEAIRELAQSKDTSSVTIFFNNDSLSEAMREIDYREMLTEEISQQYQSILTQTADITAAKDQLELTKLALVSSRLRLDVIYQTLNQQIQLQQTQLSSSVSTLRAAETGREHLKQQLFAAAYDMSGKSINFQEAARYAELASQRLRNKYGKTIPPSLLLALVKQESNFGNYLGKGNYKQAMCSRAQMDAFEGITAALQLDPNLMPVSQPAKNQSCGGAMGYAQFLPLTWLGYAKEVSGLTGHNPPSPWNPEDAFMAVALKLYWGGATEGSTPRAIRRSQWEALMTYFSGSRWRNPNILPRIRFYADNILAIADNYKLILGE